MAQDNVDAPSDDREIRKRRAELGTFLRGRRETLTPEDVGIESIGRRHVKGLRREEVAQLAGIGTSWYTLLEQGRVETIGERTLSGIAKALRLSPSEREHLLALARSVSEQRPPDVPASLLQLVERITAGPAFLMNARYDLLRWNHSADDLFAFSEFEGTPNLLERMLLDTRMHEVFPDWRDTVDNMIGLFRANYGRLGDRSYEDFVERLQRESPYFAEKWRSGVVHVEPESVCTIEHPAYGLVRMYLHAFVPIGAPNLMLLQFSPAISVLD